jgi:WD40 repeat protein
VTELRPIPQFDYNLAEFVEDLRKASFRSEREIGELVGRHRTTIHRYENGTVLPPVGYVAFLAQQFIEKQRLFIEALNALAYQQTLLQEVNKAIARSYEYERPFHTWEALLHHAEAFVAKAPAEDEDLAPANTLTPMLQHSELWGEAPDVTAFYGRQAELNNLKSWIVEDRCRLIGILGLGGMGKTMLATKLAVVVAKHFNVIMWRTLRNEPPIEAFLQECISLISGSTNAGETPNVHQLLPQFLDLLRSRRCLLVLDNIETILQDGTNAGHYRLGFENYGHLFRVLSESSHQSCLVLTSREKPQELGYYEGVEAHVRSISIEGIDDHTARLALEEKRLIGTKEQWKRLTNHYSGNLMALKMVAESIRELFDNNIGDFLSEQNISIFSDVYGLLDQQVRRLTTLEQEILYWLAIEREATGIQRLCDNLLAMTTQREVREALHSLRRRSLIQQTDRGFTLQTIVLDYLTTQLIEQISQEIYTGSLERFHRHALLKAQSKDYIRQIQTRVILKPIVERLLSIFRYPQALENHLASILASLRAGLSPTPGYAGGNIFNLFTYLGAKLSDYDFSHIAVWQAYMAEAQLQDGNFAYADLRHCIFLEVLDCVRALAFATDGQVIAAGTTNGEIRLWQITERRPLLTIAGHTDWIRTTVFSPDDRFLYTGSDDQTIKQWDTGTGQCLLTLTGHAGRVVTIALSPSGQYLASGSEDKKICLWDVQTGRLIRTLEGHGKWVWCVVFSPNGQHLISGSSDHTVRIWDVATGTCTQILTGHTSWVWSVAISPNGQTIASAGHDGSIRLWDAETGSCLHVLDGHEGWIWTVAFHPDSGLLASGGSDQTVRIWDTQTGNLISTLRGHSGHVWSLIFHPDGEMLVSSSEDRSVRLWDLDINQPVVTLYGYNGRIETVTAPADGKWLASAGEDHLIHIWEPKTGQPLRTLQGHTNRIWSVAVSPDGKYLVSGSADKTARLWDVQTGKCLQVLRGHESGLKAVFAPDGNSIATGSYDTTVRLWNVATGECITVFEDRDKIAEICSVAFSPDGQWLAIGCEKRKIWLWHIKSGQMTSLEGHHADVNAVAFTHDGKILVSGGSDGYLGFWEVPSAKLIRMTGAHQESVKAVSINSTGTVVATGSADHTICLWQVTSGQHLKTLTGHTSTIFDLDFSAEDVLISGSQDETVRMWNTETGECLRVLQADRVYERMDITGVTGITEAQRESLRALGAIEREERI